MHLIKDQAVAQIKIIGCILMTVGSKRNWAIREKNRRMRWGSANLMRKCVGIKIEIDREREIDKQKGRVPECATQEIGRSLLAPVGAELPIASGWMCTICSERYPSLKTGSSTFKKTGSSTYIRKNGVVFIRKNGVDYIQKNGVLFLH